MATTATLTSRGDLTAYRVEPEAFWQVATMTGDDGYERIERARAHGWSAVPGWGRDGWDLGSWPYVVIFHRGNGGRFEMAENIEGDVTVWSLPTRELREQATDVLALEWWQYGGVEWVAGIATVAEAPAELRGPFSWARCDEGRA